MRWHIHDMPAIYLLDQRGQHMICRPVYNVRYAIYFKICQPLGAKRLAGLRRLPDPSCVEREFPYHLPENTLPTACGKKKYARDAASEKARDAARV
jgi:hypothetical protein